MRKKSFKRWAAIVMAAAMVVSGVQPLGIVKESKAATKTLTDSEVTTLYNSTKATARKRVSVHDPSIVVAADSGSEGTSSHKYYIFGSHRSFAWSDDLKNWTYFYNNINEKDSEEYKTIFAKEFAWSALGDANYDPSGNLWAPDVIWNKDLKKWCMYMSINGNSWNSSICMLTADSLDGDWEYQGPVVYSGFTAAGTLRDYTQTDFADVTGESSLPSRYTQGSYTCRYDNNTCEATTWNKSYGAHAIDPCVYYDQTGKLWMTYGSWSGGIYTFQLKTGTGSGAGFRDTTAMGDYTDAYMGIHLAGGSQKSGEASYVQYIDGKYYLFVTYGGLAQTGGYNMRVFSSDSPKGPFTDLQGTAATNIDNGAGNTDGTVGNRLMTYYKWSFMDYGFCAEGHNSAFVDSEGKAFVIYHTRFDTRGETHEVRVHQLFKAKNGGLVTAPFEYQGETLSATSYAADDVVGSYNVITMTGSHYNKSPATCESEKQITLKSDGTVTGAYTGTWEQANDGPYVTLVDTANTVTYQGVFLKQNLEETNVETTCLTLVGNNDVSIWGYRVNESGNAFSDDIMVAKAAKELSVTIPSETLTSLSLPSGESNGVTTSWESSNANVIATDGTVTRPTDENTNVTLTVTISCGSTNYKKEYTTKVPKQTKPADITTGLKALYTFGDLTNAVDPSQTAVLSAEETGTKPKIERNTDLASNVLHQYFELNENASNTAIPNPLKGEELEGVTVSVWVNAVERKNFDNLWGISAENGRVYMTDNCYLGYNRALKGGGTDYIDINHPDDGIKSDIPAGTWKLLTVTMSSGGVKIYVDGTFVYDATNTKVRKGSGLSYQNLVDIFANADTFYLGKEGFWGSSAALMDDVRLYDRELSAEDIAGLFNAGVTEDVVAPADEDISSSYYFYQDYNDATAVPEEWVSAAAIGNLALDYDETYGKYFRMQFGTVSGERTAYLNFGDMGTLSDEYCVDFDMQFKANNGDSQDKNTQEWTYRYSQLALATTGYSGTNSMLEEGNYIWSMTSHAGSTTWTDSKSSTVEMAQDQWVHVSTRIDKTNKKAVLTITGDGVTGTYEQTFSDLTSTDVVGLFIRGGRNNSDTKIDNVRIYTYEVEFNANGGSGTMAKQGFGGGIEAPLLANQFTKAGSTFAGWADSADGTVKYTDKAIVKDLLAGAGTKVLYAVWNTPQQPKDDGKGDNQGSSATPSPTPTQSATSTTSTTTTTTSTTSDDEEETSGATVGSTVKVGKFKYKVASKTAVTLTGVNKKTYTSLTVGKTVKIKGKSYKITKIGNSAFANCKKLTKVTIGANVTQIGKKAFFKDSKLRNITVKSKKLKSVGASAFKGIHKKAKIKVPASKLAAYKKTLKGKGQASSVKIKK